MQAEGSPPWYATMSRYDLVWSEVRPLIRSVVAAVREARLVYARQWAIASLLHGLPALFPHDDPEAVARSTRRPCTGPARAAVPIRRRRGRRARRVADRRNRETAEGSGPPPQRGRRICLPALGLGNRAAGKAERRSSARPPSSTMRAAMSEVTHRHSLVAFSGQSSSW
jgi:hypothetical protein